MIKKDLLTKITVVICSFNSEKRISACLKHIFSQTDKASEIILVDHNSTDDTALVARKYADKFNYNLKIIKEKKLGLMHARATGIKNSMGDLICFVDDDNWIHKNYLLEAKKVFHQFPDLGYCGGQSILPTTYKFLPNWFFDHSKAYAVGKQRPNEGYLDLNSNSLWGAGLVLKRKSILKIINNHKDFFKLVGSQQSLRIGGDDSAICLLLAMYGWRGYYSEKLIFTHAISRDRLSIEKLHELYRGFGRTFLILQWYKINSPEFKRTYFAKYFVFNLIFSNKIMLMLYIFIQLSRLKIRSIFIPEKSLAVACEITLYKAALSQSVYFKKLKCL
jgi:glycosyltransferase involved in cell wall biosynthesis